MHRLPTKLGVPKASAWLASVWTHAPSSDETRSAEGLGVAGCHDSVDGPLPAGWGPGQSPAGAQRRTKATHDPATHRDIHIARYAGHDCGELAPPRDVSENRPRWCSVCEWPQEPGLGAPRAERQGGAASS